MRLPETTCPYCLSLVFALPVDGPPGLVECTACRQRYAPQPDGAMALPVPGDARVTWETGRFELALLDQFISFGLADRAMRFILDAERFTWTPEPLLAPLRLRDTTRSCERDSVQRFDWRSDERHVGTKQHESWSDLHVVLRDGREIAAGYRFPALYTYGEALVTVLQWAHEQLSAASPVYRSTSTTTARRPPLALLLPDGRVSPLVAP